MQVAELVREHAVDHVKGLLFVRGNDNGFSLLIGPVGYCCNRVGFAGSGRAINNNNLILWFIESKEDSLLRNIQI